MFKQTAKMAEDQKLNIIQDAGEKIKVRLDGINSSDIYNNFYSVPFYEKYSDFLDNGKNFSKQIATLSFWSMYRSRKFLDRTNAIGNELGSAQNQHKALNIILVQDSWGDGKHSLRYLFLKDFFELPDNYDEFSANIIEAAKSVCEDHEDHILNDPEEQLQNTTETNISSFDYIVAPHQ